MSAADETTRLRALLERTATRVLTAAEERDAATKRAERAERERDDLAATLETRNAEHALAVEQLAAVTAERDALRAEHAADCDLIARQAAILTAVADALKGTPPALRTHSHHDLGAVAAATVAQQAPLVACVDALRAAATAAGWRDADAAGETLVAWVRRGEREACVDAITARLAEAVREVREKTYRGTGAERDTAAAVRDAIEAVRDMIREGGE